MPRSRNARHGKRRNSTDITRAFEIAKRHELVDASDPKDVACVIKCSLSKAYDLTGHDRKRAKTETRKTIKKLAEKGASHREIAAETGVDQTTASRVVRKESKTSQSEVRQNSRLEKCLSTTEPPSNDKPTPFDKFEASLRSLYKDIGSGGTVPRAVREVVRHSKACFEAVRNGDKVPDKLIALLGDFLRDSKNRVV